MSDDIISTSVANCKRFVLIKIDISVSDHH